jgi:hypothetical protein
MSDNQTMGFGKFVPGFDFLQNLAKGATQSLPQMPNLANWVAPTLNVEELEKRIGELKAVHFWLDQNSKALGATIQALEVQKMTLATLKGMNFAMEDITNALKLRTADAMMGGLKKGADRAAGSARNPGDSAPSGDPGGDAASAADARTAADAPDSDAAESDAGASRTAAKSKPGKSAEKDADAKPMANVVDPMQWWSSLTQQFQQIAATAMKDVTAQTAMDTARNMAGGMAKEALKSASGAATGKTKAAAKKAPAKKAPAKRAKKKGSA